MLLRWIVVITGAVGILISPGISAAGMNPEAKLAMHLIASADSLGWEDLVPTVCESIDVDLSVAEVLQAGGYGYMVLLAYDVEAVSGVEFAISGWPTGRGAPALSGPYWIEEDATTFGDHLADGGATGLGTCVEPDAAGLTPLAYLTFGPLDSTDVPITLEFLPSTYSEPEDSLLALTDCTEDFVIDDVVLTSGCTIGATHGTGPDCGGRQEGGREGTGGLLIEEIWSMGEGTLPEGVSLPVRAVWLPTPGVVRLLAANGDVERDVQLPAPGSDGLLSSLSDDGSLAIVRAGAGAIVRGTETRSTRVFDLRDETVLFAGESSVSEGFWPSPDGGMVLCRHSGESSSLLRSDMSLIKFTHSVVVKWDFSSQHLATIEVDLHGENSGKDSLPWPPLKGSLYLRVYDFEGNTVTDEFLDVTSAGMDIDIEGDGVVAALYRKYDVARWTPPGTYASSDFILVAGHAHGGNIARRGFHVEKDTQDVQLALSHNRQYLALTVYRLGTVDLYEMDDIVETQGTLGEPSWTYPVPATLPGRPDVEVENTSRVQGDNHYGRVLVSDTQGTWALVPTPDLDLRRLTSCRFFGPQDYLLVYSHGSILKCFRIQEG